ncbi:hypothetical protein K9N68_38095 (plasmid) [Kovacikia minuta CCNUW1]|uniref:hypothetical protein n=1 Tax=Kovacikia minuta TaxID=2931930 RepID=UPI001CCA2828|nr:hypothetical protein [Kovacikia minuta]UBF30016.1 hypothetical protein K9N68_38095 [Kovacikia minuta CCNUW1]
MVSGGKEAAGSAKGGSTTGALNSVAVARSTIESLPLSVHSCGEFDFSDFDEGVAVMKNFLIPVTGLWMVAATTMFFHPVQAQTLPAAPQNCVYLREISTGKRLIRKVVATNNSNANTDFAVPTGTRFTSYIGKLIPENNARYTAEAYLKYNDASSSKAVSRTIQARRFYLYQQPFRTPTAKQPFQINARVTGVRNTAYQVLVLACR